MKHIYLSIIASMVAATAPVNAASWYKPNWKNLSRFTTFSCPILLKNLHAPWNFRDMSSNEKALWGGVSALLVVTAAIGGWYWWSWRLKAAKKNQAQKERESEKSKVDPNLLEIAINGTDLTSLKKIDGPGDKRSYIFRFADCSRFKITQLSCRTNDSTATFEITHRNKTKTPYTVLNQNEMQKIWNICEESLARSEEQEIETKKLSDGSIIVSFTSDLQLQIQSSTYTKGPHNSQADPPLLSYGRRQHNQTNVPKETYNIVLTTLDTNEKVYVTLNKPEGTTNIELQSFGSDGMDLSNIKWNKITAQNLSQLWDAAENLWTKENEELQKAIDAQLEEKRRKERESETF